MKLTKEELQLIENALLTFDCDYGPLDEVVMENLLAKVRYLIED